MRVRRDVKGRTIIGGAGQILLGALTDAAWQGAGPRLSGLSDQRALYHVYGVKGHMTG